tara:strand:- start:11375 stop:12799 length:1425 start_codon:yes stop_codon:yes gene_type:complete
MAFDNFTVTEVNEAVASGDNISATVLTLSPNPGYVITASDFSATITSPVNSISFVQDGVNVLMLVGFNSYSVLTDIDVPICINGVSTFVQINLEVDYDFSVLNASASLPAATINISGDYNTTTDVFTSNFTADAGFYFLNTPTCVVAVGNQNSYTLTNNKTFDTNNNLIGIEFNAKYTFPISDVTGDEIFVNASAVALPSVYPVIITSYSFLNVPFSSAGETRTFTALGNPGASWNLTVDNGATPSTYSGVIPSGGQDFIDIIIPPAFGVDYTFTLTGALVTPFPQTNPFIISQGAEIPQLQTTVITNVTGTTATTGGNTFLANSNPVLQKGVEWSLTSDFSVIEGQTNDGTGDTDFVSNITGLSGTTNFFVRAYATNQVGTGYGQALQFLTTGAFKSLHVCFAPTVVDPKQNPGEIACCSAVSQCTEVFVLDTETFTNAISFYANQQLTQLAPDGDYVDGSSGVCGTCPVIEP